METRNHLKNGANPKSQMSRKKLNFIFMKKTAVIVLIAIFALSSCTRRLVDFTIISTKNIDLSKSASFERGKTRIEGEDLVHWILFIPTGVPQVKEAIDRAIETTPGCVALLDGVVSYKFWWIPYIYGQQSYIVEGTPLIDPAMANYQNEIPQYGKIELGKNGEVKNVEYISETEYLALKEKTVKDSKIVKFKNSQEVQ